MCKPRGLSLRCVFVCLVVVSLGCGGDTDAASLDAGNAEPAKADAGKPVAAPDTDDAGRNHATPDPQVVAWTMDWIAAWDRQAAATCACLVMPGSFASAEDCMAALGSGPTWLECSTQAVANADAGSALDEAGARCLIDSLDARASCLEEAGCGTSAMSDCYSTPDRLDGCEAPDSDLVVLLLDQCPDLGLLSR
jgi:hypothetical protein